MSTLMQELKEVNISHVRGVTELELAKLTEKERLFVELVAEQPYTGASNQDVINELGIARQTYYNWKNKHASLIGKLQTANMNKLRPKLLEATATLLNSGTGANVAKGAELYLKLESKLQAEQEGNDWDKQLKALVIGMQVLVKALDVKDINDATTFVDLFAECAVDHMVKREIPVPNISRKELVNNILDELAV